MSAQTLSPQAQMMDQAAHDRAKRRNNLRENLQAGEFLLPVILIFVIITIIPFLESFVFSLTDYSGYDFSTAKFIGFSNYATMFRDPTIMAGLGFTLLYAVLTTLIVTVIALPLAVVLNKKFWGHNFARSVFFFLSIPSMALLGLVWQFIVSPLPSGAVNQFLSHFGVKAVPWLSNPDLARTCVIFIAVWATIGWHATLYIAYLQAIPQDLYEQASVDGANGWEQFVHITLPQMTPAIGVSVFMLLTSGLKVYDLPYTLNGGGPGHATQTVTQSIIVTGIGSNRYGLGSALGVVFFLCCLILVAVQQVATRAIEKRMS